MSRRLEPLEFWTTTKYKQELWDYCPSVSTEHILDAHRAHYMFYFSPPGAERHVQRMLAGAIHARDMVRDYRLELVWASQGKGGPKRGPKRGSKRGSKRGPKRGCVLLDGAEDRCSKRPTREANVSSE